MDTEKILKSSRVRELLALTKGRKLPLISEDATIKDIIEVMTELEHSRLIYVVDNRGRLSGTISLGQLARHAFAPSHEPQIHPRRLIGMLTAKTAKDIMQRDTLTTNDEESIGNLLKKMLGANVKEIPVLDRENKVRADITIVDLLKFLAHLEGSLFSE